MRWRTVCDPLSTTITRCCWPTTGLWPGPTLLSAFDRLETVEQTAKVYYYVSRLGGGVEITQEQADTLRSMVGYYQKLAGKRA